MPLSTEETCICSANANKSTGDMDITEKIHSLEERIKVIHTLQFHLNSFHVGDMSNLLYVYIPL